MIKSYLSSSLAVCVFCILLSSPVHAQDNSADCADRIEISLGSECHSAFPYEAFNTWRPSCMLITDLEGNTLAAISGDKNVINTQKLTCAIPIDSIWFEVTRKVKVRVHQIPGWTRDCDQLLNPDSVWIMKQDVPPPLSENLGCNRDTFWVPGGVIIGGAIPPINSVEVITLDYHEELPDCPEHTEVELRTDGFFQFRDSIVEYSVEIFNKTVYRVDTFSHTAPLQWVKGTQLVSINGTIDTIHGYQHTPADGEFIKIGPELCAIPNVYEENVTHFAGPNKIGPGEYLYNSYTSDSSNYCWGEINVEYKLWPTIESRKDTISCVDVSDYSRALNYDYKAKTATKLSEVCEWTEQIVRGGPRSNPLTAMRTDEYISNQINQNIRQCYTHTVTHKDIYERDFEWLCDTVVKIRTFYTDHPAHGKTNINELIKDTLLITSIPFDSIQFPDSLFAIKCGILPNNQSSPEVLAEYLYHAYDHFGFVDKNVIVDYHPNSTKYEEQSPCSSFSSQYRLPNQGGFLDWNKVFQNADYNNWGVGKAFPYINRHTKTTDQNLREKLIGAGAHPMYDADLWTMDYVRIPITQAICNINATYSDIHQTESCSGESTIYRTWTLLDWCTGETKESTQIIKIIDNESPVLISLEGKSISIYGDADDDNSGRREDHYFGRNDISDHDGNDDIEDDEIVNDQNVNIHIQGYGTIGVHWIKIDQSWGCMASYTFPNPGLMEHCSEAVYTYELLDNEWNSNGQSYQKGETAELSWLHGEGLSHPIVKLKSWDSCGNELVYYYYLKAIDKIPPVVELHDYLFVSLTNEGENMGTAKILCEDVNAGSHDGDCGPVTCEMRREGSAEWADVVHFDCADVGSVPVEVKITDYSGNFSIGVMYAQVENKNGPTLFCEDIIIDCVDPIHPDWTGTPHVNGICDTVGLVYEDEYNVSDLCFEGYITRTWQAISSDINCVQIITIRSTDNGSDNSAFDPLSIHWPLHNTGESIEGLGLSKDWTKKIYEDSHGNCIEGELTDNEYNSCNMDHAFECELGNLKEPTWTDPGCGLIGKTFEDQQVNFNDGFCFKVLRLWTVIDWCVYDTKKGDLFQDEEEYVKDLCNQKEYFRIKVQTGHPYKDGYYTYVQEIKVKDDTPPQLEVEKELEVEVGAGSKVDRNSCTAIATLTASANDYCENVNISEYPSITGPELDWYVQLTIINQEDDKETIIRDDQGREWRPIANGGNEVGHETINSDEGNFSDVSFSFEGEADEEYHVKWRVEDGCNNVGESLTKVTFKDAKAPILSCYGNLSTNVMNDNGQVEIWANDFGEAFDCGGELVTVWFKDENANLVSSLTLDCSDLEGNVASEIELKISAIDQSSNESFCLVRLRISDSNNVCNGDDLTNTALISGTVRTAYGQMTEGAEISMDSKTYVTQVDGLFAFENNQMGQDYTIEASKKDEYLNGVSTLDLVLIQKHIIGLEPLDSPYKVIAADINNDERVSSLDLVELRKLILNVTTELSNNSSWRFVNASQAFRDSHNPFPINENLQFDFLTEDTNEDFVSVKVGDVNGNARANSLETDSRSIPLLDFYADDMYFSLGELVSITFNSEDFKSINALQFTLDIKGLELKEIINGAIEIEEQDVAEFENGLTIAWTDVQKKSDNGNLFTLIFKALKDSNLASSIELNSSRTYALAYNAEYEPLQPRLVFQNPIKVPIHLLQNVPNPFSDYTVIKYLHSEEEEVLFTVFDVAGHVIIQEDILAAKGYNEIIISQSQLRQKGVYYYQLETAEQVVSSKMVLLE